MTPADVLQAAWARLPESWREKVPKRLRRRWLRLRGRHRDLPLRLTFPEAARSGGRKVRAVIFSEPGNDWLPVFVNRELWADIDGVTEVVRVADTSRVRLPPPAYDGSRSIIIPLSLANMRTCPRAHPALVPSAHALETLGDKRKFAEYMAASGLAHLCPRAFRTDAEASFPCILKRTDRHSGKGIAVARSPEELARLRRTAPWRGRDCVLQAFTPDQREYVTHCICRDGRILWHRTFACVKEHPEQIRAGTSRQHIAPAQASAKVLGQIADILAPLAFNGPCAVDYSLPSADTVQIFEINPRFGGSLLLNVEDLAQALACLVDGALAMDVVES